MEKVIQGKLVAKNQKIAIVVSRFNEFISNRLLSGAFDCIERHEGDLADVVVVWVPGAFEIPTIAKKLALSKKYNSVICLGAIIRGNTPHFDYISAEVSKGIANVSLETLTPVIFGVITSDTIEQAIERAGSKAGNKGWDAALSAIEMGNLFQQI